MALNSAEWFYFIDMRRILRFLFNLMTGVSLLVLVGVCTLWFRSYGCSDQFVSMTTDGQKSLVTRQGSVVLHVLQANWSNRPPQTLGMRYDKEIPMAATSDLMIRLMLCVDVGVRETYWEKGSFAVYLRIRSDGVYYLIIAAPFWSLFAVGAILPLAWSGLRIRRWRVRPSQAGHCQCCGYDLRATPQRCPECGAIPVGLNSKTET